MPVSTIQNPIGPSTEDILGNRKLEFFGLSTDSSGNVIISDPRAFLQRFGLKGITLSDLEESGTEGFESLDGLKQFLLQNAEAGKTAYDADIYKDLLADGSVLSKDYTEISTSSAADEAQTAKSRETLGLTTELPASELENKDGRLVRKVNPTLDDPAAETSTEEPAPQQNQASMEEPANRLAVSQQPALRTDPRVTTPGDITKRNLRKELIADEAAAMRRDMSNARRQRRIDDIFDSREADMAESWARSPTGRRDGRKWSELDPQTKQEMRNRFVNYRQNMATSSMDEPGLRGPRGDQGAPGPAGFSTQQITPFMTEEEQNNIIQQDMQLPQTQNVDIVGPPSTTPVSDAEKQSATPSILKKPQPPSDQPYDPSAGLDSLNPKPVMNPTDFVNDTAKPRPEFDPSSLPTVTETNVPSIDDLDLRPYQGPEPLGPMQGPMPMSDQDMYDMMDKATAPKPPRRPMQGPSQDAFREEQFIKNEMAKSGPDMKTYERSNTVPNPNYDYSTRNNPAAPLNPDDDPNDKRTYRPNPGGQMVRVPVYGKSGYMGYTEGRDGRFVQAPKGFDQKRHFDSINFMAPETKKQQQMERQARRGAMKNPFTFVDTDRDSDNFLKEYQYNRARDEKRKYRGTFNPYA